MLLHPPTTKTKSPFWAVLRVSSGNFLEMYDFMVFGYYAAAIGKTFFPGGSPFRSLMLSLMTFGAGFLMRPLGAVVLGAYTDAQGRRKGLMLTLTLMAIGTLSVACTPGYASIGILAPASVLIGRLLEGFSAGAELGGVSVYLSEIATPGHKGFYVSWQSGSQQVAVIFAALMGVLVASRFLPSYVSAYAWRIPLLAGCAIIPLLFVLRSHLEETDEFLANHPQSKPPNVLRSLLSNWRLVGSGMALVIMTTISFYLITAYTPTYGSTVLHLTARASLIVTLCVGVSNLIWLPLSGALSDRIGRQPILLFASALTLLTAYPALYWITASPSFHRLLTVELWLSLLYGCYNGALVVHLTEMMPAHLKTAGFSLAYSLATALFGGFTPAVCTYLIHRTGNRAMPGVWLSFAAACALAATLTGLYSTKRSKSLSSAAAGSSHNPE